MAEEKKVVNEVKAFARGIHISPRKVRLVVDLIRNLPVEDALTQLRFLTKKAAHPVQKLVDSAVANASHNFQITADRLFVKSISVDSGRVMKRSSPRAQGRAFTVRKRTSHVNLILGVAKQAAKPKKARLPSVQKSELVSPAAEAGPKSLETKPEEKKSRFSRFWRRKDRGDATKLDTKGKSMTSFDRRGNM